MPMLSEKSKSNPIIAITGADITLSILLGNSDSLSLSFCSSLLINLNRAGQQLVLVGPIFVSS